MKPKRKPRAYVKLPPMAKCAGCGKAPELKAERGSPVFHRVRCRCGRQGLAFATGPQLPIASWNERQAGGGSGSASSKPRKRNRRS